MDDDDLVETSRLPRGDDVKSWRPSGRAGGFRGFGSKRGSLHSAADIQELVVDRIHSNPPRHRHTPSHLRSTHHLQWLPSIRPAGPADYRASRQWMVGDVLLIPTSPFLNTFLFWTQSQITTGRALPRFSCSTVALMLGSPPPLSIPIHRHHQHALRPRLFPLPPSSPISRSPLVLPIPATARRATYPAHPMPSWSSVLGSGTRIT